MRPLTALPGVAAILRERCRQIAVKGWTPGHDASHLAGELAAAGASYAAHATWGLTEPHIVASGAYRQMDAPSMWPWGPKDWKPSTPERDLEKAGALIAAQLDMLMGGTACAQALDHLLAAHDEAVGD